MVSCQVGKSFESSKVYEVRTRIYHDMDMGAQQILKRSTGTRRQNYVCIMHASNVTSKPEVVGTCFLTNKKKENKI